MFRFVRRGQRTLSGAHAKTHVCLVVVGHDKIGQGGSTASAMGLPMKIHDCGTISTVMPGRDGFAFLAAVEIKT